MENAAFWVGPLGMLQRGTEDGTCERAPSRVSSDFVAIGGGISKLVAPRMPSKWNVKIPLAYSHEVAFVADLIEYSRSNPVAFVPPDALVTNVLPARVTGLQDGSFANATLSAPRVLQGVFAARVVAAASPTSNVPFGTPTLGAPVMPGMTVTASVLADTGAGSVSIWFYDSLGNGLSTGATTRGTAYGRKFATTVAPTGAAIALPVATGATYYAQPALTWTDRAMPWSEGTGCVSAYLEPGSYGNPIVYNRGDMPVARDFAFTVQEVG